MTVDEIEATFRVGCCASARLASEGCKVCGPQMRAIEAVREMARERDELRLSLRNVLALSHRIARTDPENAAHLRRFCASGGVVPSVTRELAKATS